MARIALCNLAVRERKTHFLRSELISFINDHWEHLRSGKRPKYWEQDLCSTIKHKSHSHFFHLHALNGRGSTTYALTGSGIPDGGVAVPKCVFEGIKARLFNSAKDIRENLSRLVITPKEDRIGETVRDRNEVRERFSGALNYVPVLLAFAPPLILIHRRHHRSGDLVHDQKPQGESQAGREGETIGRGMRRGKETEEDSNDTAAALCANFSRPTHFAPPTPNPSTHS